MVRTPLYIDPMIDFAFKKIFKESGKKHLIIRPINVIFGLNIADVEIEESEQLGITSEERKATLDMYCTAEDGSKFLIEVQISNQEHFTERSIFYAPRLISKDASRGVWDYNIRPVFVLGLLNFDMRHLESFSPDPNKFIHKYSLLEEESLEPMSRNLRFAFLEIQRFNKKKEDCNSFQDRFLFVLKNISTFAIKPDLWDDPYFEDFMEEAEFANMTVEQQDKYIMSMKQKWDYENTLAYKEKKGIEKGIEKGIKNTAMQMLKYGIPIADVAIISGISEKELSDMTVEQQDKYIMSMKQKWDYENALAYKEKEGIEKQAIKSAKLMLKYDLPINEIAHNTGLSPEVLNDMKRELDNAQ